MNDIHETSKIYKEVIINDSMIAEKASVGDFSSIKSTKLLKGVRIDRFNNIQSSKIGRCSYTGRYTTILHSEIGAFSSISWNVSIGGANHDYNKICQHSLLYDGALGFTSEQFTSSNSRYSDELIIGNDVWIAAGAVITRGVVIGDGAVIGANAVVTKNVPPYAIVVGSPAKVIKYRFSDDIIKSLLEIQWWNWSDEDIKKNYHILSKKPDSGRQVDLLNLLEI